MPEIRVLLYTDFADVTLNRENAFGLFYMVRAVETKMPPYATIRFQLINRHTGGHAAQKLTSALLGQFHELWVFGVYQTNAPGQPENELTDAEVSALRSWMNTGGVLITGDHANPNPLTNDPNHATYLNLGRALGYRIPRARELRRWEGPPTSVTNDNFNTQYPDGVHDINDLALQEDAITQDLTLDTINGNSHRLFWKNIQPDGNGGVAFNPILVFPDHMHEGAALVPSSLGSDWSGATRPRRVARGLDRRTGNLLPVVVAYEGHTTAGRIVGDSTWHHYFNINLRGFPKTGDRPIPGTDYDDIAQYYVNLALWLAPKAIRDQMPTAILRFLAAHPQVFEVAGSGALNVGRAARAVIEREIGISNFFRVFQSSEFEDPIESNEILRQMFFVPESQVTRLNEITIGSIVEQFHETWLKNYVFDPAYTEGVFDDRKIVVEGLFRAHELNIEFLRKNAELLEKQSIYFKETAEKLNSLFSEEIVEAEDKQDERP